jgi:hypothetical protein
LAGSPALRWHELQTNASKRSTSLAFAKSASHVTLSINISIINHHNAIKLQKRMPFSEQSLCIALYLSGVNPFH